MVLIATSLNIILGFEYSEIFVAKSMMAVPRLKYSGGKLASRSDLRVGADPGASPCASKLNTHLGPPKKAGRPKNNHLQIDFCNIRGLNSNINSVHQHLQSAKPHVLALSETKVRSSTNTVSYLYPGYEFYSRFRRNFGVCLYVRSDLSCQREETLEPKDFDVMSKMIQMDLDHFGPLLKQLAKTSSSQPFHH